MSRPHRHYAALRVVSEGVSDRQIIAAWHEAAVGGTADCIVDDVMTAISAEFSAVGLAEVLPAGSADAAIVRAALRSVVVSALRKNLIRQFAAAREGS